MTNSVHPTTMGMSWIEPSGAHSCLACNHYSVGFALDLDGPRGSGRPAIITLLGKVRDDDRLWEQTSRESWSRLEAQGKPSSSVKMTQAILVCITERALYPIYFAEYDNNSGLGNHCELRSSTWQPHLASARLAGSQH